MYLPKKLIADFLFWLRDKLVKLGGIFYYSGREFIRDQCPTRAAALTYFTILSMLPLLILIFAIFKAFGGESLVENAVKPVIFSVLSTGTGEAISSAIDHLLVQSHPGMLGTIGFIFLVLAAFSLMDQLEFNLNHIWSVKGKRTFLQRWVYYWAALSILPLLVGFSVSITAYIRSVSGIQQLSERVIPQGVNLAPFFLQGLAFLLLYMLLPKVRVRLLPALFGATVAAILWEFSKKAYLFYTDSAINYNVVYGSLATLPLFMIWLFISWMVVLYGAEITYSWQNYKTIRETDKRREVPFHTFEILGLTLAVEAARRFSQGAKPLKLEKFFETLPVPPYLVQAAAEKLVDSGLMKTVKGELLFSQNPESVTVEDVLNAIGMGSSEEVEFEALRPEKRLKEFLEELEAPSEEAKRNWNLKRLAEEIEKSSQKSSGN